MRSITVTGVNLLSFWQFAQSGRIRPGTGVIHALAENQMLAVVDLRDPHTTFLKRKQRLKPFCHMGSSRFTILQVLMRDDINSPPRHQDDIGATLDDIYTTLDDTFFHMSFASVAMPGYGKRSRKQLPFCR